MHMIADLKAFYASGRNGRWIIWGSVGLAAALVAIFIALNTLTRQIDPYVRAQTIAYLQDRFNSDVEVGSLKVGVPLSALLSFIPGMPASLVTVEGSDIELSLKGSRSVKPLLVLPHFTASADLGTLLDRPAL